MKSLWKYSTKDRWFAKSTSLLFLIILFMGGFFRLYKLNWGSGYFFHPDEYHIAAAVNRLNFPSNMNPELFSYGSFTVYLIYFTKEIIKQFSSVFAITKDQVQAMSPILIGRFYSAFFSTLTIIPVFLMSKKIFKKKVYWYLTIFLVAITPGLIQQAHFATPESIMTFFLTFTLFLIFKWIENKSYKAYIFSAISLGIAMGTKITSFVFFPLLLLLPLTKVSYKNIFKGNFESIIKPISLIIISGLTTFLTFFSVFPYSILDWKGFRHSINYETAVGRGDQIVFYTRQFIDTKPIIFQVEKILPYALGPAILVFGILGFISLIKNFFKIKNYQKPSRLILIILTLAFSIYFFSNSYLFAKWTRFIAPSFLFFSIFSVYFIKVFTKNISNKNIRKYTFYLLVFSILLTSIIWKLMFFSIYLKPDIRVTSTRWIEKNIPKESFILTESGNMLEVPLTRKSNTFAFDFYHLDENIKLQNKLPEMLFKSDYFIVQSRRIFANHQRLPKQFPITSNFYNLLFTKALGFEKVAEFNSYPTLNTYLASVGLTIADETSEETWSVFDHPVIRIYKKTKPLTQNTYEKLIKI